MTTKEEVLRLCDEVGIYKTYDDAAGAEVWVADLRELTELIELAKQAERESWASCTLSFEQTEELFPDGGNVTESGITVSAQWLHDFAKNVGRVVRHAEKESIIELLMSCDESWQAINPLLHEAIRNRERNYHDH